MSDIFILKNSGVPRLFTAASFAGKLFCFYCKALVINAMSLRGKLRVYHVPSWVIAYSNHTYRLKIGKDWVYDGRYVFWIFPISGVGGWLRH